MAARVALSSRAETTEKMVVAIRRMAAEFWSSAVAPNGFGGRAVLMVGGLLQVAWWALEPLWMGSARRTEAASRLAIGN